MDKRLRKRVALFPAFNMGHFIPMLELAKKLSASHHLSIVFLFADWQVPSHVVSEHNRRLSSDNAIDVRFVQLPPIEAPTHITDVRERLIALEEITKPLVEDALRKELESGPIDAFITDFFCSPYFDAPLKLKVPVYVFSVSSASFLCVMLYATILAQTIGIPLKDKERTIKVPGLPPMKAKDFPDVLLEVPEWEWFRHYCYPLPKAHGFLVNTFSAMEARELKALQDSEVLSTDAEYYAVGPVVQSSLVSEKENNDEEGQECLRWLDAQPPKSVLYVSFGSRAQLSFEQQEELAHGLEWSGCRFLWVLRKPQTPAALRREPHEDDMSFPPHGFLSKTQERGLVFTKWAPQVAILSHPSTGGFLSHCGWNSTLESIVYGVPVLTWPQGAEQRMNELLLVEEMKVGVSLQRGENGVAKREEVEKGVKELMRNDELTENMKRASEAARSALAEGGSSFKSLAAVAAVWKSGRKRRE